MANKMSFEQWRAKVNMYVEMYIGLGCDDLPDWDYWYAWNDGMSPSKAASEVVRNAKSY